ncbi:tricarboxylic transport: regulatory protein [Salmonella enterica subsp. enterica]|uniref:histidine kinase n=1 Tax=Salmonella enterica I TaxID=59201 RepID=A0A3S4HT65_SALET|nr:tricarboxylic transport: regulatory protein [Salmonella enterica subsp. enterica]
MYLQLLLFLGLPLILLWGLSAFNSYVNALQAATQAYDRTLLSSARTVSERLVVRNNHLEVNVPWVVLDSFELNMNDRLYYKVVDPSGKVISGYDDLPVMPPATPRTRLYPALAWFYHTEYRGEAIRVARLLQPVNEGGHYRHGGDLCRRDAAVPSLSGRANCCSLPGSHRVCWCLLTLVLVWLVITPDPAPYASTFVINGTPRTGSVNAAAGTAAVVGNTLVNRGV